MIFTDFEPQRDLGRLVDKNPKTFVAAGDGTDQRELRRLDLPLSRRRLDQRRFGGSLGRRRTTRG
jgi:hypothetical protein